jgi:PleD family two-component response regulator
MGNMIKTNFRKTDFAGRLGGEEFAVLLKDISLEEAKSAAENSGRLCQGVKWFTRNRKLDLL